MIAVRVGVVWVWAVERGRVVPGLVSAAAVVFTLLKVSSCR
jgi:hypothetical protein